MKLSKNTVLSFVVTSMLLASSAAFAQMGGMMDNQNRDGMMGMMQNRMQMMFQNPMHKSMMLVQLLPDLQSLELNADQKEKLNELRQSLKDQRKNTMQSHMAMMQGMKNQNPADMDPRQMKGQMQGMMNSMIALHTTALETYQQMLDVLSEQQRKKVEEMDSRTLMNSMMNQMPMADMMNMMQPCPMMQGGMMNGNSGGGMMNGNSGEGQSPGMSGHSQHH